jgi:N-acetylneuraminic acid mutarotase
MKLKFYFLFCIWMVSLNISAQWISRAAFPGIARAKSTAFTINDKIYVVGGITNSEVKLNDCWEYDIATDIWHQKADFPGAERYGATSFVLNNKGYVATGGNDFGYLDDLWEYTPATDTWVQKTGLPVTIPQHENQRVEAFSFVIGGYAYLGGGEGWIFGANSTDNYAFSDLWEYHVIGDTWIQRASIPDFIGRDLAIAASVNNKGYVGLGCNVQETVNYQSFWQYDPVFNTWTAKADFPSGFTVDASPFVLDSGLYVVGGVQLSPVSLSNQFYKYDPIANTWIVLSHFDGGAIAGEFGISTGTRAFVGTGYTGSLLTRNDLWELNTATLGINEDSLSAETHVKLYPNPASQFISILSKKEIASMEIYDMAGSLVLKKENAFEQVNISELPSGVYHVKLGFSDGAMIHQQFTKIN